MIKEILKYPDDRLRQISTKVDTINTDIINLVKDMIDTVKDSDIAIAMSAVQIGVHLRVIVINFEGVQIEAINPVIVEAFGEQHIVEGCLSLPGILSPVDRYSHIIVEYRDIKGMVQQTKVVGIAASVWQHELEHLDGGLYIDKLSKSKKKRVLARYIKSLK